MDPQVFHQAGERLGAAVALDHTGELPHMPEPAPVPPLLALDAERVRDAARRARIEKVRQLLMRF